MSLHRPKAARAVDRRRLVQQRLSADHELVHEPVGEGGVAVVERVLRARVGRPAVALPEAGTVDLVFGLPGPGRKPPFLAVKRPARPYKSTIETRFT
jgi:hypothetical protein